MSILDRFRRKPVDESVIRFARQLTESGYTLHDLMMQLDNAGFERVGASQVSALDMQLPQREALVTRSRLYHQFEPLVDRPVALWTEYAFGRGWEITAGEDNTEIQTVIDALFNARHNRRQFSRFGWQVNSNALLVDGERWFGYFLQDSEIRVRTFDPLEIKDVLSNPDDRDEIWYYRRTYVDYEGKTRTVFYRDWDYDGTELHPVMERREGVGWGEVDWEPQQNVYVSYLKINTLGTRGYPMMTSSLDWVREHREFMRDRVALSHARSQFAFKAKVKGGANQVNAIRSSFDAVDPTIPQQRAGMLIENEGLDIQQVTMDKDGASAVNDARMLRLMGALSSGVPDFLLGDTGNSNLATATATERPLETMFTSYQDTWVEYVRDMVFHAARWLGYSGDTTVVVDTPSILARNPAETARAIADLVRALPQIGAAPQVVQMLLTDLEVEDVEGAMDVITPLLGMPEVTDEDVNETVEAVREAFSR